MEKNGALRGVAYIRVGEALVPVDSLDNGQRRQLALWLKTTYLNSLFQAFPFIRRRRRDRIVLVRPSGAAAFCGRAGVVFPGSGCRRHKKPFGPPYWLMIQEASLGLGLVMRTGYCRRFSYTNITSALLCCRPRARGHPARYSRRRD